MEEFLRGLHSDALVALLEYFVAYRIHCLFRPKHHSSSDGMSYLCEAMLLALAHRSVELSSKHVSFIGALCCASGVDAHLFPLILYRCRLSLRRTQAVQTLRALCMMRCHAVDTLTCGEAVCTSALSSLLVRCMDLEPLHEEYDTQQLLCHALVRQFSSIHNDIRTACLWRVRRGGNRSDVVLRSPVLEVTLNASPSPPNAFAGMEMASRSLGLPRVDRTYLHALVARASSVDHLVRRGSAAPLGDPALALHQQLPVVKQLHGEAKLAALETLSHRVLEVPRLRVVVGLADAVLHCCPSLSQVVVHRILQLSCVEGEMEEAGSLSTLTALHQLLPQSNVMDVLESVMVQGSNDKREGGESLYCNVGMCLPDSLVKCLAMHFPLRLVPAMFHRLYRQRELAAFQLSPFVLRVLLQVLEYMELDSLNPDGYSCINTFVKQERLKAAPQIGIEKKLTESSTLLTAIEKCAALRRRDAGTTSAVSSAAASLTLTSTTAGSLVGHSDAMDSSSVGIATSALRVMFGASAVNFVTPEAAVRHRASLSWLYAIYRMSVSLLCELEALAALAVCQGTQLQISEKQRTLVELSESTDGSLAVTDVDDQVDTCIKVEGELRACAEEWLLGGESSRDAFRRLVMVAEAQEFAASFVSYAALSRHDAAEMEEVRRHLWPSAAVLCREKRRYGNGTYKMPRCTRHGSEALGAADGAHVDGGGGGGGDGRVGQESLVDDVVAASTSAICFVKQEWGDNAPDVVGAVCLWAYVDLLLLEKDTTMRLKYYEEFLHLCQCGSHSTFLQHTPESIHRDMFLLTGGKGLWMQGLSLLHLAEGLSKEFQLPVEAYRQVMRACLMHRVPIPAYVREKVGGGATG
ncbi:hypothetical protein DQ04_01681020 [Trypanosoma grayi]|uniref:hypothetical protein n=1 Tax=Trypanosoma grayi TaxID=71804 RepID=UPI0004F497B0|nr:hypothetical protein DQ04_01681020 [Trypanosoma grayi]KEG12472.1 hypothetical protein DQ04_01681020 [Trypanosoma grayi]